MARARTESQHVVVNLQEFAKLLEMLGILTPEDKQKVDAAGVGMVLQREHEQDARHLAS